MRALVLQFAARGMGRGQWWSAMLLAWGLVILTAGVVLPLKFPDQEGEAILDSASVVSVLVPVSVSSSMLLEGPVTLLAGAARRLRWWRTIHVILWLLLIGVGTLVTSQIVDLPRLSFAVDVAVISGLYAVGLSGLSIQYAWTVPTIFLVVFSTPGLVPWDLNFVYHTEVAEGPVIALVIVAIGIAAYSATGSIAVIGRARRIASQNQATDMARHV